MPPVLERGIEGPQPFSTRRGPFLRLLGRLRLTRWDGSPRVWVIAAIAWVPLCIGTLVRMAFGHRPPAIVLDLSVHVRLLVTVPLVLLADHVLLQRCGEAVKQLFDGAFADRATLERLVEQTRRLRDARVVELVMLAIALFGGQATLWGLFGATGPIAGVSNAGSLSFAHLWYVTLALPLVQFLILRWLWHWLAWSSLVVRVSRLPLATIATHPDHAAGIGFFETPISAFSGFVFAVAATLAAAWETQVLGGHAKVPSLAPTFCVFVVVSMVLAYVPLLAFTGMLYHVRHRELVRYNGLALDYVREFDRKWIGPRTETLLGSSDIQSMADMANTYENLVKSRIVPFATRSLFAIWIAALVPMLPLVAMTVPFHDLLLHIGRTLLGGIPG